MPDHFTLTQATGEVRIGASAASQRKVLFARGDVDYLYYSFAPGESVNTEQKIANGASATFSQPVYLRPPADRESIGVMVEPA